VKLPERGASLHLINDKATLFSNGFGLQGWGKSLSVYALLPGEKD
jgi:hypothetical protein